MELSLHVRGKRCSKRKKVILVGATPRVQGKDVQCIETDSENGAFPYYIGLGLTFC